MLLFILTFFYLARMKFFKYFLNLSLLVILLFSCNYNETVSPQEKNRKPQNKNVEVKLHSRIIKNKWTDSLAKKNKNFKNLIQNFEDTIYSIELLKDKTKQNLSYIHPLTMKGRKNITDTAAIKSRFVLAEVHLKKLNYLLNKNQPDKDSIEKTLNRIVLDINNVIKIGERYKSNTDEFKEILAYDSIANDTVNKSFEWKDASKKLLNLKEKIH